ncbi:serine hydrolase domain-containing protein [Mesorhizobium sp. VK22B]|uniref:Serine hydrolase domain-containing protein n=1 Tax=Mesorhizobium captivum TaxID=3072319 RepID=A0ABU4ZBS5_9HYPH|nr:serine hydrolase domain-containing protein [Mesorhizobium sp. VK22B]MDX8496691.1 serine hydrolase domain-containing protein [Mesorhizobium sp. VK22B]
MNKWAERRMSRTVAPGKSAEPSLPGNQGRDLSRQLDNALGQVCEEIGDPGVQAVLMKHGRLLWSSRRGMAIRQSDSPVTDNSLFYYGSVGKLFIATFVLHQVEAGVLDLDKPISHFVGDEVAGSDVVTARMLLTHTSGYPDAYADPAVPASAPLLLPSYGDGRPYDPNRAWTFAMVNAGIHDPVEPGERFAYLNCGYLLLGRVLSKAVGGDEALKRAIRRFVRRADAAEPMTEHLFTIERSQRALRRFTHGYELLEDGSLLDYFTAYSAQGIPTEMYGLPFTDSAFAGTALAGAQFLDALFTRQLLLQRQTVEAMISPTPQAMRDGSRSDPLASTCTFGMGTRRIMGGGRTWQGHTGSWIGFSAIGTTDIERGTTLFVVTNRNTSQYRPANVIWKQLAEAYAAASV